jgi:hypothetical protein
VNLFQDIPHLKKDATELALKSDSLTIAKENEAYIEVIQKC